MELFNQLIESIQKHLETTAYSFKKLRNEFLINVNNHCCRLDIEKSTSSTKEYIKFTMNIGIHIPLDDAVQNLNNAQKISKLWFQLGGRVGFFLTEENDYWWLITDEQSMQDISNEILKIIDSTIIPLFVKYTNEENVLKLCLSENPNRMLDYKYGKYCFAVLFLRKLKSNSFNDVLKKLLAYSKELDFTEHTERFLKEHNIKE